MAKPTDAELRTALDDARNLIGDVEAGIGESGRAIGRLLSASGGPTPLILWFNQLDPKRDTRARADAERLLRILSRLARFGKPPSESLRPLDPADIPKLATAGRTHIDALHAELGELPEKPVVDVENKTILRVLGTFPEYKAVSMKQLVKDTGLTRKTIEARLPGLIADRLVDRAVSPAKGWAITPKGLIVSHALGT